jgi:hypothetical protein
MTDNGRVGECFVCGESLAYGEMGDHLPSCLEDAPLPSSRKTPSRGYLVGARDDERTDFWTYFLIPRSEQLVDLDQFLRETWVDCCGHLTAFRIKGQRFESHGGSSGPAHGTPTGSLAPKLFALLDDGEEFSFEYDFNRPTKLSLKMIEECTYPDVEEYDEEHKIAWGKALMVAQNEDPEWTCSECGDEAEWVCRECGVEDDGVLCEECAQEHDHDDEAFLPKANSPRVGMCRFGETRGGLADAAS